EGREPASTQGPAAAQSGTSGGFGRVGCGGACQGGQKEFGNSDGLLVGGRPGGGEGQLVYKPPWDFLVSGNLQHQSGRPWARQVRVSGLGFPSSPTIYMEPLDGSRRVPSLNLIDARVQKTIPLGAGANLDLFLDMLNLTNTDTTEN